MSIGLQIVLEIVDQMIILRLDGRLDAATAPILERKIDSLIDEQHNRLMLDFTDVDYLSSAGMRVLLAMSKKLDEREGILILFSVNDEVKEILQIAGFDRILKVLLNEKEALQFKK